MLLFRHIRLLSVAVATAFALQATPAEAATKVHKKGTTTKKSGTRTAAVRSVKRIVAKTPPRKIDITKIEPAESLYRKREADMPPSRSLSIFGSRAATYHYDSRMMRAAEIASARAYGRSHGTCWRYVKNALLDAGVVDTRPTTGYAKQAGDELTSNFGFKKIACMDPGKAPVGSVIVYDGKGGRGAGHVEIRTKTGFVSDFFTPNHCRYPLIGVYVKP